jgi:hypothetical protein
MQHAPTLPGPVVGKTLDDADRATVTAWQEANRPSGIRLLIARDHEAFPEVIEVSPPGTTEPWWCVWRDSSGRLIVDNWHTWEGSLVFARMVDALAFIAGEIKAAQPAQPQPSLCRASSPARAVEYLS